MPWWRLMASRARARRAGPMVTVTADPRTTPPPAGGLWFMTVPMLLQE